MEKENLRVPKHDQGQVYWQNLYFDQHNSNSYFQISHHVLRAMISMKLKAQKVLFRKEEMEAQCYGKD